MLKDTPEFRALPAKLAQWSVRQVCGAWDTFWKAQTAYQQCPGKFTLRPKLPHYQPKSDGRNLLVYTCQAISRPALKAGRICPSPLDMLIQTHQKEVKQGRIIPHAAHDGVEGIYPGMPLSPSDNTLNPAWAASLERGIDILAALPSNTAGLRPFLVNGRPLKSVHADYNQLRAAIQAAGPPGQYTSHCLTNLTDKRNRKFDHDLHWASRYIVEWMVRAGLPSLIIGHNPGWKQPVNLGSVNNQNCVAIPHSRFIPMLTYKAQLAGIGLILQEEGYPSKCSCLDLEPIRKPARDCGRRVKRGEFVSGQGQPIHADIHGSDNILRKALPSPFARGIQGVVVRPVQVQQY